MCEIGVSRICFYIAPAEIEKYREPSGSDNFLGMQYARKFLHASAEIEG